jgi:hypothetical protein
MATKTFKIAIRARVNYLKEIREGNPVWFRTLIQRMCFIAPRPLRPIPSAPPGARAMPWNSSRAARKAHQVSYAEWKDNFKTTRPIVYWLTETLPAYYYGIAEKASDMWYDVENVIDNVLVQRADRWKTGLKRTEFDSADELMLRVNFMQYVDYVESTFAHRYIRSQVGKHRNENSDEEKKWTKISNAANRYPWLHFKRYTNKEYALRHLHQSFDDDDYLDHEEIRRLGMVLCLYIWWTQVRPNRGDSEEVSGLLQFRESMRVKYGTKDNMWTFSVLSKEDKEEYRAIMQRDTDLSEEWMREDTDMLVKLVKNRQNLWY